MRSPLGIIVIAATVALTLSSCSATTETDAVPDAGAAAAVSEVQIVVPAEPGVAGTRPVAPFLRF